MLSVRKHVETLQVKREMVILKSGRSFRDVGSEKKGEIVSRDTTFNREGELAQEVQVARERYRN